MGIFGGRSQDSLGWEVLDVLKAALENILAQWAGFSSAREMREATELLHRAPDRKWYVTCLPNGQWVVWDDFTYHIHARTYRYSDAIQIAHNLIQRVGVTNVAC